ncbi:hypothetical protein CHS0354_023159 [Potamilus streckersoni]|uniref:Galaxin-like repeats domain-containing protein n=1 Tax=Potamilus streckersoni TaxID=2493646 RepID=A0AAE0RN79_9BIVA|nr:hypothetical protein CHS0354_023159 [Potamilus streckersoni]
MFKNVILEAGSTRTTIGQRNSEISSWDKKFNKETHMCCNGVVQTRPGSNSFCSGTTYDTDVSICCMDTIRPRLGGNPSCCVREVFDAESNICCSDTITPRVG